MMMDMDASPPRMPSGDSPAKESPPPTHRAGLRQRTTDIAAAYGSGRAGVVPPKKLFTRRNPFLAPVPGSKRRNTVGGGMGQPGQRREQRRDNLGSAPTRRGAGQHLDSASRVEEPVALPSMHELSAKLDALQGEKHNLVEALASERQSKQRLMTKMKDLQDETAKFTAECHQLESKHKQVEKAITRAAAAEKERKKADLVLKKKDAQYRELKTMYGAVEARLREMETEEKQQCGVELLNADVQKQRLRDESRVKIQLEKKLEALTDDVATLKRELVAINADLVTNGAAPAASTAAKPGRRSSSISGPAGRRRSTSRPSAKPRSAKASAQPRGRAEKTSQDDDVSRALLQLDEQWRGRIQAEVTRVNDEASRNMRERQRQTDTLEEQLRQEGKEMQLRLTQRHTQQQKASQRVVEAQKTVAGVESRVKEEGKRLKDVQKQRDAAEKEVERLMNNAKKKEEEIAQLQQAATDNRRKAAEQLRGNDNMWERERDELAVTKRRLQTRAADLDAEIATLLKSLKKATTTTDKQTAQIAAERTVLETRKTELGLKLADVQDQVTAKQVLLGQLKGAANSSQKEKIIADLEKRLEGTEKRTKSLSDANTTLMRRLHNAEELLEKNGLEL